MPRTKVLRKYQLDASLAQILREEHGQIDKWFEFVVEEAGREDWHACYEAWHPFVSLVERHLQFEERYLFPALIEAEPGRAQAVEALTAEHEELRAEILRLSIDIELKVRNTDQVQGIVNKLRRHAEHEEEVLYPWIERAPDALPSKL